MSPAHPGGKTAHVFDKPRLPLVPGQLGIRKDKNTAALGLLKKHNGEKGTFATVSDRGVM